MAKTITLNLSGTIGPSGPLFQESVSQAGLKGRALQSFGQNISKAGQQIGGVVQRRRDEDARNYASFELAKDDLDSKTEMLKLKKVHADNPEFLEKEAQKLKEKRHKFIQKNAPNDEARALIGQKLELSKLETSLESVSYVGTQRKVNFTKNTFKTTQDQATADFLSPPSKQEFDISLNTQLLMVDLSDSLETAEKEKMKQNIIDTRMKSAVLGHTDGGSIQDYARAKDLVKSMETTLGPERTIKMDDLIETRRLKSQERIHRQEKQDRITLTKQFKEERSEIEELIQAVDSDSNADISEQLNRLKMEGKIDITGEPHIISRERMGIVQKETSTAIRLSLLDNLAETDNPNDIRDELFRATLTGQLSSQDASAVLNSIKIRTDSKYSGSQFKRAKQLIKGSERKARSGPGREAQNERQNLMTLEMEILISQHGVAPQRAAKIVLKDRGLLDISELGRVKGLTSGQDTLEGLEEAKKELFKQSGTMSDRDLVDNLEIIENRQNALELIPTIDEITKGGR